MAGRTKAGAGRGHSRRRWGLLALGALGLLAALTWGVERPAFFWDSGRRPFRPASLRAMSMGAIRRVNGLPITTPVVISQVGRADPRGPYDELGMPAHWIELHNRSRQPVSLQGYSLTDNLRRIRKWPLPGITLPPGGHSFVWADGKAMFDAPARFGYWDVKERAGWYRFNEFHDTQDAFAYYRSNSISAGDDTNATARLIYVVDVARAGRQALWLRLKPLGQHPCLLEAQVNGRPSRLATVKPRGEYEMVPMENPEAEDGLWPLKRRPHTVEVTLLQGEVICNGGGLIPAGAPPEKVAVHANFKPRAAGEFVALFAPHGLPADYVSFPPLPPGQSYRRNPPEGERFSLGAPAPHGLPFAQPPRPSLASGLGVPGQALQVAPAAPGDCVRYTLNGALPTESDPILPSDLIIEEPTTIRLRSFREGAWPSPPVTRVFWSGPPPALPVLWLATDEANLRDRHRGIMINAQTRAAYGERPAYACLIAPDGATQAADVGLRIQGRSTRDWKAKLPFRILCRPRYGAPAWPGPVFAGSGPTSHVSFIARSYNQVFHPLGLEILRRLDLPAPRTRPVLLMVNSQPFGLYFLMEDVAAPDWLAAQYGHLDLDVIKHKAVGDPVIQGTRTAYEDTWGRIARDEWGPLTPESVAQVVDLRAFTRWIAAVQYLGLRDNDQGFFVRDRKDPEGRWSFLNWDWDGAFYDFANGKVNSLRATAYQLEGVRGSLWRALIADPGYLAFYLAEFQALLNHPLAPELWLETVQAYADTLLPLADFESQGHHNQQPQHSPPEERTSEYLRGQIESDLTTARAFFETRGKTLRRLLAKSFNLTAPVHVRVATEPPDLPLLIDGWPVADAYAGEYFPGTPLSIRAADGRALHVTIQGESSVMDGVETNVTTALDIQVRPER